MLILNNLRNKLKIVLLTTKRRKIFPLYFLLSLADSYYYYISHIIFVI
jgi:hypothetical protein